MSGSGIVWMVLAVLGACALLWGMRVYNRLVELRNRIANAFGQIDVQLKRRHDLIPNLVEVAKKYMEHENATLAAVTQARGQAQGATAAARAQPGNAAAVQALATAEQALMGQVSRLLAVAESYPDLKADQNMRNLSEEIASTENRIGFARQAYNDAVLDLNNAVQAFPDVLLARLTGFACAAPLESTRSEAERAAPRVSF